MALALDARDIAGIVLRTTQGGTPVTVGDIGSVKLAPQARLGVFTHDGLGETIVGVADMQYGLNAGEVLCGVPDDAPAGRLHAGMAPDQKKTLVVTG